MYPPADIARIASMVDEAVRNRILKRTALTGIISNAFIALLKLVIGLASGSLAIVSDAANNLSDMLSSIVTIVGFNAANRRPTHSHPLGFGRMEYISALFVAFLVIFTGASFFRSSADRIAEPSPVSVSLPMVLILIVTILVKIALWRINIRSGKAIESEALSASGSDALSDALATTVTIIAAVASTHSALPIDGIAGIIVSVFILYSGVRSVIGTVSTIVGERPTKDTVALLRSIINSHPPISGGYDIQIHTYGPSRSIGTCNVEVPSDAMSEEVFDAMTDAQEEILDKMGIYMTFGMYAVNTKNPVVQLMRQEVLKVLRANSPAVLGIHGFHVHFEDSRVHFDVVVDFSVTDLAAFRAKEQKALEEAFPTYRFSFNIDPDYA